MLDVERWMFRRRLLCEDDTRFNLHLHHNLATWPPLRRGALAFGVQRTWSRPQHRALDFDLHWRRKGAR